MLGVLALLCAGAGYLLLSGTGARVLSDRPAVAAPAAPRSAAPPFVSEAAPSARAESPAPSAGSGSTRAVVPPSGQGPAGDPAIQRLLDAQWPADLPAVDERQLTELGIALLRADATGLGRSRFPGVFPQHGAVAPAFSRFRVQAAVARGDRALPGRAVVHLVWAGADRGGTYADNRITELHFTRIQKEGNPTWHPTPLR
ncbi:hypothetical protein ACFQ7N_10000 [Streptomyces niveus]|uniref:hypothetical protein n=1 Tax=Streptomyces niveus TaxID=193462 RepID=UPI00369B0D95